MAKLKNAQLNPYLYCKENGLPSTRWHEDMPDLTGQALADAQDAFDEADDMPLWIQLELDLWEGKNGINEWTAWDGINEWTAWDVEGGTNRV